MESTAYRFTDYATLMQGRAKMGTIVIDCGDFASLGAKYSQIATCQTDFLYFAGGKFMCIAQAKPT
jgi:hypothetical protein